MAVIENVPLLDQLYKIMPDVSLYKKFNEISIAEVPVAGSKNASLGEMFTQLSSKGINVPDGFATTAFSLWYYIDHNK